MSDTGASRAPGGDEPVAEDPAAPAGQAPTVPHAVTDADARPPITVSDAEPPTESVPFASEPPPPPPVAATEPPVAPPVPPPVTPDLEPAPSPLQKVSALIDARPEVGVGGAFGGGLLLALILKRLGR